MKTKKLHTEYVNNLLIYMDKIDNGIMLTVYDELLKCTIETKVFQSKFKAFKRIDLFKTEYM